MSDAVATLSAYRIPDELRQANHASLLDWVKSHIGHPDFEELVGALKSYPQKSTVSAEERAYIYTAMLEIDARNVLEIGTYFAGTTELMARAAKALGCKVWTIDPYGAERAPKLIGEWPDDLAKQVVFRPQWSTQFLGPLNHIPTFDLIFIDGNHRYPNVIHDLYASDENLRLGGIMIADNAEQPDVMDGVRHFVRDNPGYQTAAISLWGNFAAPGTRRRQVSGDLTTTDAPVTFVLLRKPGEVRLYDKSLRFHIANIKNRLAPEIRIAGHTNSPGRLEVVMHLASLPRDTMNAKGASIRKLRVFDLEPGPFDHRFDAELILPEHVENEPITARVEIRGTPSDGSIGELDVHWGEHVLSPNRNFLRYGAKAAAA